MMSTQYCPEDYVKRSEFDHKKSKVFSCNVCLWTFESEEELDIHNYLEHLVMKKYARNETFKGNFYFYDPPP